MIDGFAEQRIAIADGSLHVEIGGAGPAVVLLHGFPQDHSAWRAVAPRLAERARVICPDLRGYGRSTKPAAGPEAYAKRVMADDLVALLDASGIERATVVGHDRGALVAFRAALDHPDRVERLGVVGVIPTLDLWDSLHGTDGVFAAHLFFLAQPGGVAEALVAAAPDMFFGRFLDTWSTVPGAISPQARAAYLEPLRSPAAIHAVCADYAANAFVDPEHDAADRRAGRQLHQPVLAMWEDPGEVVLPFDPAAVWSAWAPDLETRVLPGGHLVLDDCPDDVVAAIEQLLDRPIHADRVSRPA